MDYGNADEINIETNGGLDIFEPSVALCFF